MSLHTRLFVGNIPNEINENILREAFSKYGEIITFELKYKVGEENKNRFAFITLSASNYNVEKCIKDFSNKEFDGQNLYVTRARESFLERLQRERTQANKQVKEQGLLNDSEEPVIKKNPVINLSSKLNPKKRNFDTAINFNDGTQFNNSKLYKNEKHFKSNQQIEENIPEKNDISDNDIKKKQSEIKRLESLRKKRQEFKEKKMIIKSGLFGIDKVPNKKVVFSDIEENEEQDNKNQVNLETNTKQYELFNEEDSDTDVNFEIKNQFEGKKGQKILDLQSRYKSDKRFTLDERFVDDTKSDDENSNQTNDNDENEAIDGTQVDEKFKQLNILQDVLGVSIKTHTGTNPKSKSKLGMLRYDPSHPEHEKFLVPTTEKQEAPKKLKKKKIKDAQEETKIVEPVVEKVEVSKEQFYNVSETLKEAIGQTGSFSLRNLFTKEDIIKESSNQNTENFTVINEKSRKTKNPLDPNEKNPFVYDSSDSETEEQKTETNILAERLESKAVWRENLFFYKNDSRLREGLLFFNQYDNIEAQKERRGLKSIMKKRIYNKERKNQMFQKKIGGRKKTVKKSIRRNR